MPTSSAPPPRPPRTSRPAPPSRPFRHPAQRPSPSPAPSPPPPPPEPAARSSWPMLWQLFRSLSGEPAPNPQPQQQQYNDIYTPYPPLPLPSEEEAEYLAACDLEPTPEDTADIQRESWLSAQADREAREEREERKRERRVRPRTPEAAYNPTKEQEEKWEREREREQQALADRDTPPSPGGDPSDPWSAPYSLPTRDTQVQEEEQEEVVEEEEGKWEWDEQAYTHGYRITRPRRLSMSTDSDSMSSTPSSPILGTTPPSPPVLGTTPPPPTSVLPRPASTAPSTASSTYSIDPTLEAELSSLTITLTPSSLPRPWGSFDFAVAWEVSRLIHHSDPGTDELSSFHTSTVFTTEALGHRLHSAANRTEFNAVLAELAKRLRIPALPPSNGAWPLPDDVQWSATCEAGGHLRLNPPRVQARGMQRRVAARFGADRVLSVRYTTVPRNAAERAEAVQGWVDEPLELCGREWRCFFVDMERGRGGKGAYVTAWYFAESGSGLGAGEAAAGTKARPVERGDWTSEELVRWMLPLEKVRDVPLSKLWSRIELSLSTATPTVTFTWAQIRLVPDIRSPTGLSMNDGCSVVSPAAMRLIADALGLADVSPPAAVQGRLGGAKGVWFVDPATPLESDALWIEVTESQLKYPFHDADADGEPDWARLTLFVLAHSKPPAPAHLNRQFIPLLSRAGVPFPAFAVALEAHLDAELAELTAAVHDPPALRHLLHRLAGPNREGRPHPSGAPVCHELWLAMLLEAGFTPGDCAFLATRLDARFAQECADVLARAHVRVPKSTQLFCIADPTGTLAEGEVAVQFSGGVIDPVTRYSCDALVGDVLVARNPATQGSDVQKVRAVRPADERLRRLKDVVVFSTLGDTPLASLLSGGDYDGDKPWVCWDPSFVEPFRNSSPPPPPTDPTLYVAPAAGPRTLAALPANDLSKFFATGFAAALADTQLGLCSYALEAYTYLHAPDATSSLMSWLASALVDAPKAGLMATPRTTQLLRDVCSRVRKPAYATPGAPKPSGPPEAWHVLDRLLLHTGALALDARRVSFAPAAAPPPDPDLLAPFLDAGGEPGVRGVVDRLHEQLQELMGVWNAAMRETRAPFEERVGRVWERYAAIKPDVGRAGIEGRALARRWASAAGSAEWGVMRASALVAVQRDGAAKAPWWLATGDLCRIKAAAGAGGVRCMRSEMYAGLKPVRIRVVEAE